MAVARTALARATSCELPWAITRKFVGLYRSLVLEHAILRNAHAVERGAKRTHAPDQDSVLYGRNHHGRPVAENDDMPHEGDRHGQAAEEQAPEATPECHVGTPELDPVAGAIKASDFLAGVISFADNTEMLMSKPASVSLLIATSTA